MYKIVDPHNYLLMTIDGKLLRGLFEHKKVKASHDREWTKVMLVLYQH